MYKGVTQDLCPCFTPIFHCAEQNKQLTHAMMNIVQVIGRLFTLHYGLYCLLSYNHHPLNN